MGKFVHLPKDNEQTLSNKQKKNLLKLREALYRTLQDDNILCADLIAALQDNDYAECSRLIAKNYQNTGLFDEKHGLDAIHELVSWAGREDIKPTLSPALAAVLQTHYTNRKRNRTGKRRLITLARLNPDKFQKDEFLSTITTIPVQRLTTPFPPPHLYISENEAIYQSNMEFVLERHLPDWRKWRKLIFQLLSPRLLSYDLPATESAIFEDANGPVAVVIRNACNHKGALKFMDTAIKKVIDSRYCIRARNDF